VSPSMQASLAIAIPTNGIAQAALAGTRQ
jgi:hypothetical protein